MAPQIGLLVVVTSGPPGYLLKVCNCRHFRHLLCVLHSKTNGFCKVTLFRPNKSLLFVFQNMCFTANTCRRPLWLLRGAFSQKPSFYLSARLTFSKGCSPRGRQPFKNLQLFNISLLDFISFYLFVLKCIWFS